MLSITNTKAPDIFGGGLCSLKYQLKITIKSI